jgi:hypothetical protein
MTATAIGPKARPQELFHGAFLKKNVGLAGEKKDRKSAVQLAIAFVSIDFRYGA